MYLTLKQPYNNFKKTKNYKVLLKSEDKGALIIFNKIDM